MNPYNEQTFLSFFITLAVRLGQLISGNLSFSDLVSDEIQILVLIGVAFSTALLGTFLVLRKMTMLANSLSHTILLGIVCAFLLTKGSAAASFSHEPLNTNAMLLASVLTGIITTFLTEFLIKVARLQEDASTGIIFTSLFALGIIVVTVATRHAHIGTEVVMGNVDALQLQDCEFIYTILGLNIAILLLFFKEFKITTFDSQLANALGISTLFFNYLLMIQVSATTIGAFRAVGVLMVLAFTTGPALTARLLTNQLKIMLLWAAMIGCLASIIGVALARHLLTVYGLALTTGGVVVCVITGIYVLAIICYKLRSAFQRMKQRRLCTSMPSIS